VVVYGIGEGDIQGNVIMVALLRSVAWGSAAEKSLLFKKTTRITTPIERKA